MGDPISIAGWSTKVYFMEKKRSRGDDFRVPHGTPEIPEMWGFEWQKWEEKAELTRTMMRPVVVRHLRLCFLAPVHWKNVPKGLYADVMTPRNMPISSCKRGRGLLVLLKVVFYMHCLVLLSRKVHTFAKANFGAGANLGAFTREGEGHVAEKCWDLGCPLSLNVL